MRALLICLAAGLLAACANLPREVADDSPCVNNEASYACQVERYSKVHAD
jgi:starvation-inducible outer membrane lipoprotein